MTTGAVEPFAARPEAGLRSAAVEVEAGSWTPARMRAAVSLDLVVGTEGEGTYPFRFVERKWRGPRDEMPATTMGQVFYTDADTGIDYSCSGTVVGSLSRNLVWTAGHCVHGGAGRTWHRNWIFVPGYSNGRAPFGVWPAARLATTSEWATDSNVRFDLGAARLRTLGGERIGDVVGGQGIVFESAPAEWHRVFGYAAAPPPYDGRYLRYCRGPLGTLDENAPGTGPAPLGMGCNLGAGFSGAAWLKNFDGGAGFVVSVVSYKYGNQPNAVYGPYQGAEALALYRAMSR